MREGKNCNMRLYIPESNIYPCAPQKKNGKGLGVRKEDIVEAKYPVITGFLSQSIGIMQK